jgi:hypothetical protein
MHTDEHLVVERDGLADLSEGQKVERTVGVVDDRFHDLLSGSNPNVS